MVRPGDCLERLRALPISILVRVPLSMRDRHARVMSECLEGMTDGDMTVSSLEQARSKLLLGMTPRASSLTVELGIRFALWEKKQYAELLLRTEDQAFDRHQWRRRARKINSRARLERIKRMARDGAYRKVVISLPSERAEFSVSEQR